MKRLIPYLIVVVLVTNNTSCTTVRIRTSEAQSTCEESVAPHGTLRRFLWGLVWNDEFVAYEASSRHTANIAKYQVGQAGEKKRFVSLPNTACCTTNKLSQVRVKTTFLQGFLTVITLGIYCPIEISWECAKDEAPDPGEG